MFEIVLYFFALNKKPTPIARNKKLGIQAERTGSIAPL